MILGVKRTIKMSHCITKGRSTDKHVVSHLAPITTHSRSSLHFLPTLAREKEALIAQLGRERTETQVERLLHPRIFRKKK